MLAAVETLASTGGEPPSAPPTFDFPECVVTGAPGPAGGSSGNSDVRGQLSIERETTRRIADGGGSALGSVAEEGASTLGQASRGSLASGSRAGVVSGSAR